MESVQKKTAGIFIYGIGNIEIDILQAGNPYFLKQIELFVLGGSNAFTVMAMSKVELKDPIALQTVIQVFVNHILEGQEDQSSSMITKHFRNWVAKQNGSLKNIINGYKSVNGSSSATTTGTSSSRMEAARKW